jgi:hypothetical protein
LQESSPWEVPDHAAQGSFILTCAPESFLLQVWNGQQNRDI